MVTTFLPVKHRLDKMVGMKDFFGQDLTAMVKLVHTYATAVLRQEDVYVAVGRVTMKLALDIATETTMAVA